MPRRGRDRDNFPASFKLPLVHHHTRVMGTFLIPSHEGRNSIRAAPSSSGIKVSFIILIINGHPEPLSTASLPSEFLRTPPFYRLSQKDCPGSSEETKECKDYRPDTTINMLPNNVLLEIFDLCQERYTMYHVWGWHFFVHVCRRWRQIIFDSPHRLNLRIFCTQRNSCQDESWYLASPSHRYELRSLERHPS
ncbi:hypothetical protein EDB84DRAFT_863762 [Lactarius hengduanensis]|nr:hypothetical protein EDB84DRAFT_863762 [Lactarius hengduanensis]